MNEGINPPVLPETGNKQDFVGKIFLTGVIFLVIGAALGILLGKTLFKDNAANLSSTAVSPKITTTPNPGLLTDPLNILQSRVFIEWTGSVEGKMVEKTPGSFTLEKNNQKLTIYIQKSLTLFMGDEVSPGKRQKLTLDQIPVGTFLRGGVTISRGSLTGKSDQHVVANGFTVIKELGK